MDLLFCGRTCVDQAKCGWLLTGDGTVLTLPIIMMVVDRVVLVTDRGM